MDRWIFDEKLRAGELVLSGALTVDRVGELKELLLKAIGQAQSLRVDLAGTAAVDVAGVQLLCAAHRLACSKGKALMVVNAGNELRQLVRGAGFTHAAVCYRERESACLWAERS